MKPCAAGLSIGGPGRFQRQYIGLAGIPTYLEVLTPAKAGGANWHLRLQIQVFMASTHAAQIAPLTMPSTPPLEGLYGGIGGINLTGIR